MAVGSRLHRHAVVNPELYPPLRSSEARGQLLLSEQHGSARGKADDLGAHQPSVPVWVRGTHGMNDREDIPSATAGCGKGAATTGRGSVLRRGLVPGVASDQTRCGP